MTGGGYLGSEPDNTVTPAKAGVQSDLMRTWIPAYAGMTMLRDEGRGLQVGDAANGSIPASPIKVVRTAGLEPAHA